MAVEKTFNGVVYNSDTSFAGYLYVTALLSLAGDIMADAGRGLVTTSASSHTLGAGTGTINLAAAIPYKAGAYVLLADAGAPSTNYAIVQVTADVTGVALAFTEIMVVGSGTITAWNVSVSGPPGAQGEPGTVTLAGSATGAIDMASYKITVDAVNGRYANVGNVTGTCAVTEAPYSRIALTGDTTVTIAAPTASTIDGRYLEVVQGASGAWTPTFTGYTFLGTEPAWTDQAADHITLLAHHVTPTGLKHVWFISEVEP